MRGLFPTSAPGLSIFVNDQACFAEINYYLISDKNVTRQLVQKLKVKVKVQHHFFKMQKKDKQKLTQKPVSLSVVEWKHLHYVHVASHIESKHCRFTGLEQVFI